MKFVSLIDKSMITTGCEIPGYTITKSFGVVIGNMFKIPAWTWAGHIEAAEKTQKNALESLIQKADTLGANAIIGLHFTTFSDMIWKHPVFIAYGTAVYVEKK